MHLAANHSCCASSILNNDLLRDPKAFAFSFTYYCYYRRY
jgi:hypothetical protein